MGVNLQGGFIVLNQVSLHRLRCMCIHTHTHTFLFCNPPKQCFHFFFVFCANFWIFYHLRQRVCIKKRQKIGLCISKSTSPYTLLVCFFFVFVLKHTWLWSVDTGFPVSLKKITLWQAQFLKKKLIWTLDTVPISVSNKEMISTDNHSRCGRGEDGIGRVPKSSFKNTRKQSTMEKGKREITQVY